MINKSAAVGNWPVGYIPLGSGFASGGNTYNQAATTTISINAQKRPLTVNAIRVASSTFTALKQLSVNTIRIAYTISTALKQQTVNTIRIAGTTALISSQKMKLFSPIFNATAKLLIQKQVGYILAFSTSIVVQINKLVSHFTNFSISCVTQYQKQIKKLLSFLTTFTALIQKSARKVTQENISNTFLLFNRAIGYITNFSISIVSNIIKKVNKSFNSLVSTIALYASQKVKLFSATFSIILRSLIQKQIQSTKTFLSSIISSVGAKSLTFIETFAVIAVSAKSVLVNKLLSFFTTVIAQATGLFISGSGTQYPFAAIFNTILRYVTILSSSNLPFPQHGSGQSSVQSYLYPGAVQPISSLPTVLKSSNLPFPQHGSGQSSVQSYLYPGAVQPLPTEILAQKQVSTSKTSNIYFLSLKNNLLSYWEFENTSWLDSGPGGNTLTAANNPTITSGVVGNAVQMTTNSPNSPTLSHTTTSLLNTGAGSFTVAAWVKAGTNPNQAIIMKSSTSFPQNGFSILNVFTNTNHWQFLGMSSGASRAATSTLPTDPSHFQFIVGMWNAITSQCSISVNNETIITSVAGNSMTDAGTDFIINNATETASPIIDQVGFWNRMLTQNEISQLYNQGNGLSYAQISPSLPIITKSVLKTWTFFTTIIAQAAELFISGGILNTFSAVFNMVVKASSPLKNIGYILTTFVNNTVSTIKALGRSFALTFTSIAKITKQDQQRVLTSSITTTVPTRNEQIGKIFTFPISFVASIFKAITKSAFVAKFTSTAQITKQGQINRVFGIVLNAQITTKKALSKALVVTINLTNTITKAVTKSAFNATMTLTAFYSSIRVQLITRTFGAIMTANLTNRTLSFITNFVLVPIASAFTAIVKQPITQSITITLLDIKSVAKTLTFKVTETAQFLAQKVFLKLLTFTAIAGFKFIRTLGTSRNFIVNNTATIKKACTHTITQGVAGTVSIFKNVRKTLIERVTSLFTYSRNTGKVFISHITSGSKLTKAIQKSYSSLINFGSSINNLVTKPFVAQISSEFDTMFNTLKYFSSSINLYATNFAQRLRFMMASFFITSIADVIAQYIHSFAHFFAASTGVVVTSSVSLWTISKKIFGRFIETTNVISANVGKFNNQIGAKVKEITGGIFSSFKK